MVGLALHVADFFLLTVTSLEYVAMKKFGNELGNDDHNNKWTMQLVKLILVFNLQNCNMVIYSFI